MADLKAVNPRCREMGISRRTVESLLAPDAE